ncbi:hypothetical protein M917_0006 [Psychrobacter aquaticus CMS 56]|uniref:Uncharacterized protein n=1 Tax=Psychrobacter aquaticus CMS 56 TaxID=1354303 RepID=U4TAG1_9GAMM|nr:hypothetical protein M917_0006 [Psychrobacter aquaticus CMS 56]
MRIIFRFKFWYGKIFLESVHNKLTIISIDLQLIEDGILLPMTFYS